MKKTANKNPVKDFSDLNAWKIGRELRKAIYDLVKTLPPEEKYVLGPQLRRAAISVTANLAEGFGRYTFQETMQFSRQSRGSAFEVHDHLTTVLDAGYASPERWRELDALTQRYIQILNGYIRATRARQSTANTE